MYNIPIRSQVVCFTVRRVLNAHVGQSLVHKREFGSFVTTPSFTYLYDHQATRCLMIVEIRETRSCDKASKLSIV